MSNKPLLFFVEPHSVMREREPTPLERGSKVVQEHAFDCDVTNILNRYQRTGQLPVVSHRTEPTYGDASVVTGKDYGELQDIVRQAGQAVKEAQDAEAKAKAEYDKAIKTASKPPSPPNAS